MAKIKALAGNTKDYYKEKEAANVNKLNEAKADVEKANLLSKQEQAIAARDAEDFNTRAINPYNVNDVKYDENGNIITPIGNVFKKGGLVQKLAKGGSVKKEEPLSKKDKEKMLASFKPRDFAAEKANYETQTRGANQADGSGISSAEMAYKYAKLISPPNLAGATVSAIEIGKNAYNGEKQDPLDYLGLLKIPYVKEGMKQLPKLTKQINKLYLTNNTIGKANDVVESYGYSKGGEIKGKGGPTDDKIDAEVEEGSFVVPAKNAEVAKELKEKVLMKAPKVKANLNQKGGAKVKLSNGEYLLTPEEKEELLERGVNVDLLAPNSNSKIKDSKSPVMFPKVVGYAEGGEVSSTDPVKGKSRSSSTGVKSADELIDNAYKNPPKTELELLSLKEKVKALTRSDDSPSNTEVSKFLSWVNPEIERVKSVAVNKQKQNVDLIKKGKSIEKNIFKLSEMGASNDILKSYKEEAMKYDDSPSTIKYSPDDLFDKYKAKAEDEDFSKNKESVKKKLNDNVQSSYKRLADIKNNPKDYTADEIKKAQDDFDKVASYRNKINKAIDENDIDAYLEAKSIVSDKYTKPDGKKVKAPVVPKTATTAPKTEVAPNSTATAPKTEVAPKVATNGTATTGATSTTGTTGTVKSKGVAGKVGKPGASVVMERKDIALPTLQSNNESAMVDIEAKGEEQLAQNIAKEQTQTPITTTTRQRRGLADMFSNVDPTAFIGLGQAAAGYKMLKGEKRPEWKAELDPAYQNALNRANKEAQYGLRPEDKFLAEQNIQNALNDANAAGVNYAAGSGTTAYNLNRSAANDAWRAKLGLSTEDAKLRMDKQQYADQLAKEKASLTAANRRQAYVDAMKAFQQRQEAGSELVGTGLANTIGAYRFNQDLRARQAADKARTSWSDNWQSSNG
jgi:hypothetical protein